MQDFFRKWIKLEKDFADGVKNFHNVDLRDLFKIETGESGEIGWGEIWSQSGMSNVKGSPYSNVKNKDSTPISEKSWELTRSKA